MLKQFVLSEDCEKCKDCCQFHPECTHITPLLTDEQKNKLIAQGVITESDLEKSEKLWKTKLKKGKDIYYICTLNQDGKCTVHHEKPFDCCLYPFGLMYSEDKKKVMLTIDLDCPTAKRKYNTKEMYEYVDYLKKHLTEIKENFNTHPNLIEPFQEELVQICELEWN